MAATMTPLRHDTPFSSLYDNPATTLPSVDFGFADLRERMAAFTQRFDDFISRGRQRVLEERNAFRLSIAELSDAKRTARTTLEALASDAAARADAEEREAQETEELEAAVAALNLERDEALARRDVLADKVAGLQKEVATRRAAVAARQKHLSEQGREDARETKFWEESLGLRIEGGKDKERIRFVFRWVDERIPEREGSFVLDMRSGYTVDDTVPALDSDEVDAVVERLNDGGEVAAFLKAMRALFVQAYKEK